VRMKGTNWALKASEAVSKLDMAEKLSNNLLLCSYYPSKDAESFEKEVQSHQAKPFSLRRCVPELFNMKNLDMLVPTEVRVVYIFTPVVVD